MADLRLGTTKASKIYLGNTLAKAVYLGGTKVWPTGPVRPTGTSEYSHTLYNGTTDIDLATVSPWIENVDSGSYHIGYQNHPLIPSAIGAFRAYNCYICGFDLSSSNHWVQVQVDALNTATDNNAGVGVVLRHNNHYGVFCKVMKSGGWRIYTGESGAAGQPTTVDGATGAVLASGTLPRAIVRDDVLLGAAYSDTVEFWLINDTAGTAVLLGSATIGDYYGRLTGAIISMNNAGELKNFYAGRLNGAPSRSVLRLNKSGTITGSGLTYAQVTGWTAVSGTTLTSNAIVIQSGQQGLYGIDWRCNWNGGNGPKVMLQIKINGVVVGTTAAQDTLIPTSYQMRTTLNVGDVVQAWWYGEGSFFTYPVMQAAQTYLQLVPL